MRKTDDGRLVYSPTDLIRYLESPYAVWMDRYNLERPGELTPDEKDPQLELVASEGDKHEAAYLAKIRAEHGAIVEVQKDVGFALAADQTRAAIEARASVIYQAALASGDFAGYADFLKLGPAGEYEVWDTKLGRSPKPYYMVQLCCYADLLSGTVGKVPSTIGVVMVSSVGRLHSTGESLDARSFRTQDYWYYYLNLKESFLRAMAEFKLDLSLRPEPDARADHGRWQSYVDAWVTETDHLSQVADIKKSQIKKLEAAGICTVAALAQLAPQKVPKLAPEMLGKLINQRERGRDIRYHI